jgi:hypothetical protein
MNENQLSRSQAIEKVVAELQGPIPFDTLAERVLAIWPSKAKYPKAGIRDVLQDEHLGKTLIEQKDGTLLPVALALKGASFRVLLSQQEVEQGCLFLVPTFLYLVPKQFTADWLHLVDETDRLLPTNVVNVRVENRPALMGGGPIEVVALDLGWWYRKLGLRRQDYLVVTILDWPAGKVRLQLEPAQERRRRQAEIERSNRLLADTLFDMLEEARHDQLACMVAIPTLYGRTHEAMNVPADHWLVVLENDGRMIWDGYSIGYADDQRFANLFSFVDTPEDPPPLTADQANQLYCFKANLKYRKGLWRRIEILGGQTLGDLDGILRDTFEFDPGDHLSGFWQRIRRGHSRRFREVDLGTIYPYGGEENDASDKVIASLELAEGAQLKYVYDFGDWIEVTLQLEKITRPDKGVEYPRVAAQNKPRYRYCAACREQGRKSVATFVCIDCSNAYEREVLMCEACIQPEHEDHYLEEMLY